MDSAEKKRKPQERTESLLTLGLILLKKRLIMQKRIVDVGYIVGLLFGLYINLCRSFDAKSIFIQIISCISHNSV